MLNSEGDQYDSYYTHDYDVSGAKWMSDVREDFSIYTDSYSGYRLLSQGGIIKYNAVSIFRTDRQLNGYVYLGYTSIIENKLINWKLGDYGIEKIENKLQNHNKIFNNRGVEVYLQET